MASPMTQNKQTLLIIISAFLLGVVVNEYRHQQSGLNQNPASNVSAVSVNQPELPQVVGDIPRKEEAVREVIRGNDKAIEAFSWARVNQLVADAHYDEAIHLLQAQMGDAKNAARAWLVLATIYKKQSQPIAAVDAWFRYLKLEMDDQKINKTLGDIKDYLLQLKESPSLFNEDYSWLMAQCDELLKYNPNDGELHLVLAALLLQLNDGYQAQYHALMAANDPKAQKNAEVILAQLNGKNTPEEITIPLIRYGNQYLVTANIEGNAARLLVDTGASLSGLSNMYTAKYPSMLKAVKPIRLNTASGTHDSFLFTVTNISIENLAFNQHILTQLPMDNSQGFDGLLGVDILGRFDFVIDQNAAVLRLKVRK
jgi:predicted aspartyl protease